MAGEDASNAERDSYWKVGNKELADYWHKHQSGIRRRLRGWTNREDLVSEALATGFWKAASTYDQTRGRRPDQDRFPAWWWQRASWHLFSIFEEETERHEVALDDAIPTEETPEKIYIEREDDEALTIEDALGRMNEDQQRLAKDRQRGATLDGIGSAIHKNKGTVSRQLQKAREAAIPNLPPPGPGGYRWVGEDD